MPASRPSRPKGTRVCQKRHHSDKGRGRPERKREKERGRAGGWRCDTSDALTGMEQWHGCFPHYRLFGRPAKLAWQLRCILGKEDDPWLCACCSPRLLLLLAMYVRPRSERAGRLSLTIIAYYYYYYYYY